MLPHGNSTFHDDLQERKLHIIANLIERNDPKRTMTLVKKIQTTALASIVVVAQALVAFAIDDSMAVRLDGFAVLSWSTD